MNCPKKYEYQYMKPLRKRPETHYQCPLCKMVRTSSSSSVFYKCDDCNITFNVGTSGDLRGIDYQFKDMIIDHLYMDLVRSETTIFFTSAAQEERGWKSKAVPGIWPNTQSKDALALAKRLNNLIAFS